MMADVVLLPRDLTAQEVEDRTVVVLDVLRATTSMVAALAAGVGEIRVFQDIDSARASAAAHPGPRLLCGEKECLAPPGFDLGNSPGAFSPEHAGRTAFMSTTNGTRAIAAARKGRTVLLGALVNAAAVAREVARIGRDVTFLCAGANGQVAMEDVLGAGAILAALRRLRPVELASDRARMALRLFEGAGSDLASVLREAEGGRNVVNAGLGADVDFAAGLDTIPVVGVVQAEPLRVVAGG